MVGHEAWGITLKQSSVLADYTCSAPCARSVAQSCLTLCDPRDCSPLSMGFSRQEYWSGLPFPPPGDLPDPGVKPTFLESPASTGGFFTTSATWEAPCRSK